MIIFFIVLILTIVFISLAVSNRWRDEPWVLIVASATAIILISISSVMIYENTFPRIKKKRWEEHRNAIVYEMDHGFYVGDSLGDFNSELRTKQMIHKNPWVSWFSGEYIMEIKPISTEREE